jgi:uncharacterized protein with HEPN domain
MTSRDARYLRHMLDYAERAVRILGTAELSALEQDETMRLALERALEIIGEAASKVSKEAELAAPELPWRDIIGTRHVLAHDYESTDLSIIYNVVRHHLPPLIETLTRLLRESET